VSDWSPQQYLTFADERTRPARDLLARVPLAAPGRVYDLGCGPGNSTALLVEAFPYAEVIGIDNSPAMLDTARQSLPGIAFIPGDLSTWQPEARADLLFSNAAFHWVPDHLAAMARLIRSLPAGGVLAVQMPDNLDEPSHRLMAETAAAGPWAAKLAGAAAAREALPSAETYYRRLKPLCAGLDIWRTTYHHPLKGAAGIVSWVMSTGLRPYLEPLDEDERRTYLDAYRLRLADAYPEMGEGVVLLRFPRLFIVARA